MWRFALVILLLILAAFIFVETPFGQNWLAKKVTEKFSKELHTKISFDHISFSLLDKLNLEGLLLRDQQNDTLLYAGKLQVRITDWFVFKNKAELKYIGLENSIIKLQRKDSVWNYQFIADFFTPSSTGKSNKQSGIQFNLKKLSLKNVVLAKKDEWAGQDIIAGLGDLQLDAREINPDKKVVDIASLYLVKPQFSLYTYQGKDDSLQKEDTVTIDSPEAVDSLLKWNQDGWIMNISLLKIDKGSFKTIKQSNKPAVSYFDPNDIEFSSISGKFNNLRLEKDTFSAKVSDLATEEKSGFLVKSLNSDVKINPQGMSFSDLDLKTNNSTIRNSFSMGYNDMSDMADFVHNVSLRAVFDKSQIASDDVAFFAPELKPWEKNIGISGTIKGTITDLLGKNLVINAGSNTYINGDITMSGLPDINQTFIDFKSNDTRTTYTDAVRFLPAIKGITKPDLASLGYIHFVGSFTGFMHDFVTFGTIHTNLGTIKSDLNMKLPPHKQPIYSGNIATKDFQLGKFIHNSQVGIISFSGIVKGHGSTANTLNADLKATISEFDFNGYRYHNVAANGTLEKQLFNGYASVNDSNLQATLNGLVNINGSDSKFDLLADVQTANLKALQIMKDDMSFNGKFNLNFTGDNIDNFLGSARITDARLMRNDQRLSFDSLVLYSQYANGIRTLTVSSNEFDGSVTGDFHIDDLSNAIQVFLNKYYPSYVKAPAELITHQNFKFSLQTRNVDTIMQLFDKHLRGFNDSRIDGSLDLAQSQLQLNASIPQFTYDNKYNFSDTKINANGTLAQLNLDGSIQNVTVNDSINLPNTSFSVLAKNDSSKITITTATNEALAKADLNANVITYSDGVKINFDTSSFVVNTKTWTIDKGGELSFRSNTNASGEVVLHEGNQKIKLRTVPSGEGTWNDLLIDLANVNLGDISPYISRDRLEGLVSGSARIENPGPKMTGDANFDVAFFRYNEDSIGELNISDVSYNNEKDGNLKFKITNPDPVHVINATANIYLSGKHDDNLISVKTKEYQLKFLETFLGDLFADIQGYATGNVDIKGSLDDLNYVGKAHLHDAGLKLKFTDVFYKLKDTDINLRESELDLGSIKLIDTLTNATATLSGTIYHESWKNMYFDLEAKVDNNPMTLLNTTEADNNSFYGHAIGTGSMILVGSENDMYMTIDAKSSEKDSSHIVIPPEKSKASELADFLVQRTHGSTLKDTLAVASTHKMTFDIDLTADPHTTIEVILDEVTGDVVKGRGRGSLNIHSATGEPLTLNGNIDIEDGSYLFTFQSFFKRPFVLRKGGNNYIRWNGDPNKATIHFDAQYTAENVSFSPLASFISDSRIQTLRDNVYVIVTMSGELFKPDFSFKLEFPPSSIATSDPILPYNIQQIENNPNELNKQVTYLIVFNSFAPVGGTANSGSNASTSNSGGFQNAINELAYNTISSLLFNELNKQFSNILAQIFKDDKLKVNLTGSVYNRNFASSTFINTGNVNVTLSRALFNDRFIITAGSTLDIPFQNQNQTATTLDQKFQFLPDVSTEWLINEKGTIRATFFYRQNLDFEPGATTTSYKNKRIGAGLSYRKEFNHLGELFRKKKDKKKQNNTTSAPTADNATDKQADIRQQQ